MSFRRAYTVLTFVILLLSVCIEGHIQQYAHCKIEDFQRKFDILPGRGWDNLRNEPMGQILDLKFSRCQYSQDNIYLIPDSVSMIPTKTSKIMLHADYFSHFSKYTTVTSNSINIGADFGISFFSISGSYSKESVQVKIDQLETNSSIFRVQLRYNIFKSMSEPDAELNPIFRNRILDIAKLLQDDKDSNNAAYLSDMIVHDFGTHVIQSVDAGGVLSKIDLLNSQFIEQYQSDKNAISVSASASFFNMFSVSGSYSNRITREKVIRYDESCLRTRIETFGGAPFGPNFHIDKWRQTLLDNLVAIDRKGNPIYFSITQRALPELDASTVHRVYLKLKDAVNRYYSANARRGCLDIHSANFNSDANIDGKSCTSPSVTFNFGGAYQTCRGPSDQCNGVRQVNPSTRAYSCPKNYKSVLLHSGLYDCSKYCRSKWRFFKRCQRLCSFYYSFWCFPTHVNETASGYLFGGFLSKQMTVCPLDFVPVKFGPWAQMCVSVNNNPLNTHAIKFGGFYSCSVGNPLAREFVKESNVKLKSYSMSQLYFWPKSCPKGYMSHILTIDNGCEISYCTETNKFTLGIIPIIVRPPFISPNFSSNSSPSGKNTETKLVIASVFSTFFAVSVVAAIILIIMRNSYKKTLLKLHQESQFFGSDVLNYGTINNTDHPD